VPIFHKPLLTFALDNLIAAGAGALVMNTHYLPEAFADHFGREPRYRGRPLRIFHEPLLLDTGGGIRNARSALGEATFFLFNGDILADLPLAALLSDHRRSGAIATLLLGETGGVANVRFDAASGRVFDLRGGLGVDEGDLCVYCGVAVAEPEIFNWISGEGPSSIIDALLAALRAGEKIGGMLFNRDGHEFWMDLGTPASYLQAHRALANSARRPGYIADAHWPAPIHPEAHIHASAVLEGMVAAGPRVTVGEGAFLRDSILWPGAVIGPGARIEECVVRGDAAGSKPLEGIHRGVVL
jgi:NDP-sugar pyrophosphorylase family protein